MANPIQLLMLASLAGTLAWGGYEITRDNRALPEPLLPESDNTPAVTSALPTLQRVPIEDFAVVIERPLFFSDRKLPPKQAQETKLVDKSRKMRGAGKVPDLKVTGIFLEGEDSSALVEMLASGNNRRLQLGDTVSGWKLVDVTDQAITLQSGRQRHQYPLRQFAEAVKPQSLRRGPARRPGQPLRPRSKPAPPPIR